MVLLDVKVANSETLPHTPFSPYPVRSYQVLNYSLRRYSYGYIAAIKAAALLPLTVVVLFIGIINDYSTAFVGSCFIAG